MLLRSDTALEGFGILDQFDSPFMHEAFLRASEGRICSGPVEFVDEQGYRLAWEEQRSSFALGATVATYWAHGYGPIGGGFCSSGGEWERSEVGFHTALDRMADASGADLIVWPYFPLEAREFGWLCSWLSGRLDRDVSRLMLSMREHKRAFLDARAGDARTGQEGRGTGGGIVLSRNKRKTLGRQVRRLEELGGVHFRSTLQDLATDEAMERFLLTESSGWKAQHGTALAVDEKLNAFVMGFMPQMIEEGRAQVDLMMLDDKCIAGLISLRAGRGLFSWKTGMDEVYKRFSPGVHMLLHVSEEAVRDDSIDYVDSLADQGHPVAEHIWAGRRRYAQLFLPLNSHGIAASQSLRAAMAGKDSARYWLKKALGRA
ncbi:GNAT family N-acetyltransferase [uncultured Cohaesibacter sp.]|uniref:GNAT family N-acetyltransferase n=1 Tax=uncultured Cohaesibacter sp. TaxID=1002546 RepID=UPI0029C8B4A5|nr:GNAT family N-acetyltransferase [uncultured Cohaesibacter sp.]